MQIIEKELILPPFSRTSPFFGSLTHTLILDIETTGLSAHRSRLYLIGCLFCTENTAAGQSRWQLRQWFLDSQADELAALREFLAFTEGFSHFITFNGATFDLPYLYTCAGQYHIAGADTHFERMRAGHTDLLRLFRPLKSLLSLPDARLKTYERAIGIAREDRYSGFDLIAQYEDYAAEYRTRSGAVSPQGLSLLHNLLLHNEEDISNIPLLLSSLPQYSVLFCELLPAVRNADAVSPEQFAISGLIASADSLVITGTTACVLPADVRLSQNDISLQLCADRFRLTVPFYRGELKYYYEPYTDYYYLPDEDMAVHKKIAQFVDAAHRKKATRQTCYTRKTGCFLPQLHELVQPVFSAMPGKQPVVFFEWEGSAAQRADLTDITLIRWCADLIYAFCPPKLTLVQPPE